MMPCNKQPQTLRGFLRKHLFWHLLVCRLTELTGLGWTRLGSCISGCGPVEVGSRFLVGFKFAPCVSTFILDRSLGAAPWELGRCQTGGQAQLSSRRTLGIALPCLPETRPWAPMCVSGGDFASRWPHRFPVLGLLISPLTSRPLKALLGPLIV